MKYQKDEKKSFIGYRVYNSSGYACDIEEEGYNKSFMVCEIFYTKKQAESYIKRLKKEIDDMEKFSIQKVMITI